VGLERYASGRAGGTHSQAASVVYPSRAPPVTEVGFYCAGTLIQPVLGETPVKMQAVGDRLVAGSGSSKSIRWIGRRTYSGRFPVANPNVQPITSAVRLNVRFGLVAPWL
jgi:Hint domain